MLRKSKYIHCVVKTKAKCTYLVCHHSLVMFCSTGVPFFPDSDSDRLLAGLHGRPSVEGLEATPRILHIHSYLFVRTQMGIGYDRWDRETRRWSDQEEGKEFVRQRENASGNPNFKSD